MTGTPRKPYEKYGSARKRRIKQRLLRRDGDSCWLCGSVFTEERPPTIDHVLPRSHGGTSATSNLKLAHATCNNHRGNP